jgi:uncharacterized protein
VRHVLYLHGFASSAKSKKAAFFADRLRPYGINVQCPDFNEPDFASVTVSRMIQQVEAALAALEPGPVALIGSSLGGFVAFHTAVRRAAARGRARTASHPVDRLILLAPAFDFGRTAFGGLDAAALEAWRRTDAYEVFHWGENRPRALRFAIYEDAQDYDSAACALDTPALVIQGRRDTVVDPAMVSAFAAKRPFMATRMVDDDHLLMSSLDLIWEESAAFLGLPSPPG